MVQKLNFLYCFDKNYNFQAFSSMISLLDCVDEKINLHILHTDKSHSISVPQKISDHANLGKIEFYEFIDYDYNFPNIENVHISVATYFRLFITNYLPKELNDIIYLDPDVICIKNPITELKIELQKLTDSKKLISAKTEHTNGNQKLSIKNSYFNAGVMLIDLEKWRNENLQEKLILNLKKYRTNIVQWDQDVLNSYFDGDYIELNEKFNHKAEMKVKNKNSRKVLFIHYMGSHKPWLTSGVFMDDSIYYHRNYRKISSNYYHILHKWKRRSLFDVLIAISSLRILKLENIITYMKEFLASLNKI